MDGYLMAGLVVVAEIFGYGLKGSATPIYQNITQITHRREVKSLEMVGEMMDPDISGGWVCCVK